MTHSVFWLTFVNPVDPPVDLTILEKYGPVKRLSMLLGQHVINLLIRKTLITTLLKHLKRQEEILSSIVPQKVLNPD